MIWRFLIYILCIYIYIEIGNKPHHGFGGPHLRRKLERRTDVVHAHTPGKRLSVVALSVSLGTCVDQKPWQPMATNGQLAGQWLIIGDHR